MPNCFTLFDYNKFGYDPIIIILQYSMNLNSQNQEKKNRIKIMAVGDICPGDKYILGLGVLNRTRKYGVDFPFEHVRKFLQKGDIVLGNFEGLLSKKTNNITPSNLSFCGQPEFASAMVRSGFNVVNVANNHILEHGKKIFLETITLLKNAGLKVCGLKSDSNDYYSDPVFFDINDRRIGILGYNWVGIDKFQAADALIAQSRDSIVNYTWDRNQTSVKFDKANFHVINDIKKLKQQVDFVILITHWGYEFVTVPPFNVIREAKSFVDAGVDLIIGGHPHVLQGMEKYKSSLIFYSLGNFIFDRRNKLPRYSAIVEIDIYNSISYKFMPCFITNNFQPVLAGDKQAKLIEGLIEESNNFLTSKDAQTRFNDETVYKRYEQMYNRYKGQAIIHHFTAIGKNPIVIKLIFTKIFNFMKIILNRIRGKRARW